MFSHESRCEYRCNQLAEVICQLRFPEILTIGTTVPDRFQEAIRMDFPGFPDAWRIQLQNSPAIPAIRRCKSRNLL